MTKRFEIKPSAKAVPLDMLSFIGIQWFGESSRTIIQRTEFLCHFA